MDKLNCMEKSEKRRKDDFMVSVLLFLIFVGVILLVAGVLFLFLNSWKSRKGIINSDGFVSKKRRVCIHTQARYQMIPCPNCLSSFCHKCLYENGGRCLKCDFQILEFK